MKLTVLGSSGSMPGPQSPASGYLVEAEGYRLLLDLGNGAFGALQRHVSPFDVDAIVISHLHPDHCIDLTSYVVALRYAPERTGRKIPLIGPTGTRDRLHSAYDPFAKKLGLTDLFSFSRPGSGELGPFAVSFALMNHPVPTHGIRLTVGDRTLVYSADTGESEALIGLASDADVMLCEATFGPEEPYVPDLHLTGQQAGEHAARAGVDRLIVTHVPPWGSSEVAIAEAKSKFDGSVEAAEPDATYWV